VPAGAGVVVPGADVVVLGASVVGEDGFDMAGACELALQAASKGMTTGSIPNLQTRLHECTFQCVMRNLSVHASNTAIVMGGTLLGPTAITHRVRRGRRPGVGVRP
jgi:hypothetical protein